MWLQDLLLIFLLIIVVEIVKNAFFSLNKVSEMFENVPDDVLI